MAHQIMKKEHAIERGLHRDECLEERMTDETGGPAFPRPYSQHEDSSLNLESFEQQDGMTLRDYFAAKALPAIVANSDEYDQYIGSEEDLCKNCAAAAYAFADAMLWAREQKEW
jgi:hypothetical protein